MISRRTFSGGLAALAAAGLPAPARATPVEPWARRLIEAAIGQIGRTTVYDPAYVRLNYPMGDIDMERGVCTDVVIRAYREAFGIDLQKLVHEDMAANFSRYPKIWGLKRPDRNIDHRRVPNLEVFLKRRGAALAISGDARDYRPGDLVTQRLPGNLPHIAIVTGQMNRDGTRPLVVHNIGAGTRLEDRLFAFTLNGHFRFAPGRAS